MSENVRVTVIVLAYNHSQYIRKCIDGVLMQQTCFKFEILIHDDASSDGTADIIREYYELYPTIIKPIFQAENKYSKGIPIGANYLYPIAKGDYIAECEGDDYWIDPFKLQKQVDILDSHSNLIAVVSNSIIVDNSGSIISTGINNIVPGNVQGTYNLHDFFRNVHQYPTATILYRNVHREEITKKQIHTWSKYLSDWTYWAILHSYGDFYYLDEVTSAYRVNPNSVTHTTNRIERAKAHMSICKTLSEVLPQEYKVYLRKSGWMYFSVAMAYRKEKKYIKMLIKLIQCLVFYPCFTTRKMMTLINNKRDNKVGPCQ